MWMGHEVVEIGRNPNNTFLAGSEFAAFVVSCFLVTLNTLTVLHHDFNRLYSEPAWGSNPHVRPRSASEASGSQFTFAMRQRPMASADCPGI